MYPYKLAQNYRILSKLFNLPTETVPLINVIAKYIYHDNDARLATLAVIALQKICVVSIVQRCCSHNIAFIRMFVSPISL